MICPCGSQNNYSSCCEAIINGSILAKTSEELMRSRYTAFANNNIDYIVESTAPEKRSQYNSDTSKDWSNVQWLGLKVVSAKEKVVEFVATYKFDDRTFDHHEISKFRQIGPRWYFVEGDSHVHEEGVHDHHHAHGHHHINTHQPKLNTSPKPERNDPCPCGSGKKFKKCHGT